MTIRRGQQQGGQNQGRPRLLFVPRQFEKGHNGSMMMPQRPVTKAMVPVRPASRHYTHGYMGSDNLDDVSRETRPYIMNREDSYMKKMSGRVYYNGE